MTAPPRAPRHDPLAALRLPNFRLFAASRFGAGAAMTLLQATIAWQVYTLSGSPLALGLLGLVRFLPSLGVTLIGGAVADTFDRRRVILVAQVVPFGCSLIFLAASLADVASVGMIYALVLVIALASAFEQPARQALLPVVVPPRIFANAVTVTSTAQSLSFVTGPAIAGLAIAVSGVSAAYALHAVLIALAMAALAPVRPLTSSAGRRAMSVAAVREGVRYVRTRQALLGSMMLDMFAVIFGGAQALLPIYATDILGVGAVGYGMLSASLEVGALLSAATLIALPPIQRTGRALEIAVAGFGVATILFGLSRSFPLSIAAYMLVGAADQVSVVMRNTTVQLATPDALRGRVSSVNSVFIGASNQLGAAESGLVAAATTATFAVVSGGVGCLVMLALVAWRLPGLRSYRAAASALASDRHAEGASASPPGAPPPGG